MRNQATSKQNHSTTNNNFFYTQPDLAVMLDPDLCKTAKDLYNVLVFKINFLLKMGSPNEYPRTFDVSISELAELINRSPRTVCTHLATLIALGIIIVIRKRSPKKKGWNLPNEYILVGRHAPRYQNSKYAHPAVTEISPKISQRYEENSIEDTKNISSKNLLRTTLKGEAETSQKVREILTISEEQEWTPNVEEASNTETLTEAPKALGSAPKPLGEKPSIKANLEGVPDIMHPTAEYWLMKTGHTRLTDKDKEALQKLANTQYPTYVNKTIDRVVQRFIRLGNPLSTLHLGYIAKCMEGHRTYDPTVQPTSGNKKAAKRTPKKRGAQEAVPNECVAQDDVIVAEAVECAAPVEASEPLAMPIAEAEKVIAEHEAEQSEQAEQVVEPKQPTIPQELSELYDKMRAAELDPFEEYMETLPKDDDGSVIFPEDEAEIPNFDLTLEQYLALKFPEAEEEELHRDYSGVEHADYSEHPEYTRIQRAFEIERACAFCMNPEDCKLPCGCKAGSPKLEVALYTNAKGQVCLGTKWGECVKCKHPKVDLDEEERLATAERRAEQQKAEYERRVNRSGLAPAQQSKTFETYDQQSAGAECIVAKAMAILASKEKRNLVLAGKAGTGKTHLAVSIALEAMKSGEQAIVKSAPELMDELISANRNNTDPYGLMMKYKSVPCLVLDDLGKQTNTEAVWKYLYELIDYRYTHELQTIVTTNAYSMEGLLRRWNEDKVEPIVSRLLENGDWVTLREAKDYRMRRRSRAPESESLTALPPAPSEAENEPVAVAPDEAESVAPVAIEPEQIDAWLDEQCDMAEMSDEEIDTEIDAMMNDAAKAETEPQAPKSKGIVIHAPSYDDGLDDDEEDLKLYGGLYSK